MQQVVDSKMIFANILQQKGYGCSVIAKYMGMNHASILHYFKKFPWYLKTEAGLRNNYERIRAEYFNEYDPVYYLSENELKKELFSLRFDNKKLSSQLSKVEDQLANVTRREDRLGEIFQLITERTRPNTEPTILSKLRRFYNGVYDN